MNMNHPRGCVRFWATKIRACLIGTKPNRIHIFFREHRSLFGVAPGTRGLVSLLPGGLATFVRATSAPFMDERTSSKTVLPSAHHGPEQTLPDPSPFSMPALCFLGERGWLFGVAPDDAQTSQPFTYKNPASPAISFLRPKATAFSGSSPSRHIPPRTPACIGIARRRHLSLRGRGERVSPSLLWLRCTPRHAPNGRVVGVHDAKEVRPSYHLCD